MIVCRSRAEIEKLRRVNQLVAQVLAALRQMAAPGVTTADTEKSLKIMNSKEDTVRRKRIENSSNLVDKKVTRADVHKRYTSVI